MAAMVLLLLFSFFAIVLLADSVHFQKTSFDQADPELVFHGDATASLGEIQLNGVDNKFRVGWVTYAERVRLWDSQDSTKLVADFNTHFKFVIGSPDEPAMSDGLAFFMAPVYFEIPPNSAGGYLGLFNKTTVDSTSLNHIVMVEFDTWNNSEFQDPTYPHVGINENSIVSAKSVLWSAGSHIGDGTSVWITYNATTTNLSVVWTYDATSVDYENTTLSHLIDIGRELPEFVMVGFSASTGLREQRHVIQSWEFNSSLDSEETKRVNVAPADQGKSKKVKAAIAVMSVSTFLVIILAILAFVIVTWRMKNRTRSRNEATLAAMNLTSFNEDLERGAGPRRFLRGDLVLATNSFSKDRKLGEGGFGAVYKGYLLDIDMPIAVKKISRGSKQGRKEYATEVKIFSQLRHRNLVQLIGWCHDSGEFLLVYEFMPNGSLDSHLFSGKMIKTPLAWDTRHRIALGLASALLYLHEEWEQCVVHRDIKSSNIMLDSSFNVKLGDFGLARLVDHEDPPQTTAVAGTYGYMAPEYIISGRASKESDVFSFGVVALEIATGRKCVNPIEDNSGVGLVEWVWGLYGGRNLHLGVDVRLRVLGIEAKQVECLMVVGLWCAHPDHALRPSIREAIQVLKSEGAMPSLPVKMPALMYHVPAPLPAALLLGNSCEPFISKEAGR